MRKCLFTVARRSTESPKRMSVNTHTHVGTRMVNSRVSSTREYKFFIRVRTLWCSRTCFQLTFSTETASPDARSNPNYESSQLKTEPFRTRRRRLWLLPARSFLTRLPANDTIYLNRRSFPPPRSPTPRFHFPFAGTELLPKTDDTYISPSTAVAPRSEFAFPFVSDAVFLLAGRFSFIRFPTSFAGNFKFVFLVLAFRASVFFLLRVTADGTASEIRPSRTGVQNVTPY